MQLEQGDFVILKTGKRPELARISKTPEGKKGSYAATLCKDTDSEKRTVLPVEFTLNEVMSNLGKKPKVGSVYGTKVEPLLKTRDSKYWKEIRFYTYEDEGWEKRIVKGIAVAYQKLDELRLTGVQIELEIRQPGGKFAGWYKHRPKLDIDLLCVKPETNGEGLNNIVWHEYGHAIWFRRMTGRQRLAWIKLYHDHIGLQEVDEGDLENIRNEVEGAGSIGAFWKDADEQTQMIFKSLMRQISQVHNLNKHHLNLVLANGDSLEDFWPTSLELSEKEVLVTDYARKSPEELFAESFALHVAGKKLPKTVRTLMETTLSKLTRPQGAQVAEKRQKPDRDDDDKPTKIKTKSKKHKRKEGLK